MLNTKKIITEIITFSYEKVDFSAVEDLLEFLESNPKTKKSIFSDGTNVLISYVKINISNNKPYNISVGVNVGGVVRNIKFKPNTEYYFKGSTLVEYNS